MTHTDIGGAVNHGFSAIELSDWRQFDHLRVNFHPRLTILTGANASGKSTVLGILARHFNWARSLSRSPVKILGENGEWSSVGKKRERRLIASQDWDEVGSLQYANGVVTQINEPILAEMDVVHFDLWMPLQQAVQGMFLTPHRSSSGNYSQVQSIPTTSASAAQMFEQYTNEIRTRWQGSSTGKSAQLTLKESLISAAVFGSQDSEYVEYDPVAREIWLGFQKILRNVLPKTLGFSNLRVRRADVLVVTRTGEFLIDESSGGVSALIEMAWQIFLCSRIYETFTVLMDEPENHLHPSLQRSVMASLLDAFPGVQFIVATHSPFVVTSTKDSRVFALEYNEEQRVFSRELNYANKAASADETLRRVLGVESTMPRWAEVEYRMTVDRYMRGGMTEAQLAELRLELERLGLESEFPEAVVEITDGQN